MSLVVAMLHFFEMEVYTELRLTNQLRIRIVTKEEKYPDGTPGGHFGWGLFHGYPNLYFVIDSLKNASGQGPETEILRLATALLVFKPELTMLSNELEWFFLQHGGSRSVIEAELAPMGSLGPLEEYPFGGYPRYPRYVLKIGERDDFISLWKSLVAQSWSPNLQAAARRLIQAHRRSGDHFDEDRLVDLTIAYEALLVKKNERNKGRALSERGARLTGLTGHLLDYAKKQLALTYDLRNDIVHDGMFGSENTHKLREVGIYPTIEQLLLKVEQYLRIGMKEYIFLNNRGYTKQNIIDSL